MPYTIKKSDSGYKVCKKAGGKCFSKSPLSKAKATAQMRAIYANEKFDVVCSALLNKFRPCKHS